MSIGCVDTDDMLFKVLEDVSLSADKDKITFTYEDGTSRSFRVEGDCCSRSWIEHLERPSKVKGAVILAVEESDLVSDHDNHDPDDDYEDIKVYNIAFRTTYGDIILEFRNSSNGYYGGYLVDSY